MARCSASSRRLRTYRFAPICRPSWSEAVQMQKPDPRIFARALAEVGCLTSQAWFVGDHPVNDVLGAAASGLRPIWLTGVHPWPMEHPEPQWQMDALIDLVAMVQHERTLTT
jgi:putative hydrolase of the HAD superfamily